MRRITTAVAALALTATLAACGGSDDGTNADAAAYDVVAEASIEPGDEVPAPTGDVVLTLTGNISVTNAGDALELDMETLESLQVIEYETPDLQAEGGVVTFSGVLLSDLLDLAGAEDPTTLVSTALNDYSVDIPAADLEHAVMIATRVNGERMTVERYGPVRVVYPYSTEDLDPAIYDPRWIWQLASIDVQ